MLNIYEYILQECIKWKIAYILDFKQKEALQLDSNFLNHIRSHHPKMMALFVILGLN